MASGSKLASPSTPSTSHQFDITKTAVYEFIKSFLSAAKIKFDALDIASVSKCKNLISDFVGGAIGTVTARWVGKSIATALKEMIKKSDKNRKKREKNVLTNTIDAPSSKEFKDAFIRVFVELSFKIYFIYKNSFERIYSEANIKKLSNKTTKTQKILVIQNLAKYAGSVCFNFMLKNGKLDNVESSLTDKNLTEKSSYSLVLKTSKGGKKIEITDYDFFMMTHLSDSTTPELALANDSKLRQSFRQKLSRKTTPTRPAPVKNEFSEEDASFFAFRDLDQESLLSLIKTKIGLDPSFCWKNAIWNKLEKIEKNQGMLMAGQEQLREDVKLGFEKVTTVVKEASIVAISTKDGSESISFQVDTLLPTVYGRNKFVGDLHTHITNYKGKAARIVIVGTGGVGKTTVVHKYIEEHQNYYQHVIWIHAQDFTVARDQFRNLALKLKIQSASADSGENMRPIDFDQLREEVYENLCRSKGTRVLLVLDNAEAMPGIDAQQSNGIQSLLPQSLPVSYIHPAVIITSRESTWDRDIYQIRKLHLWTPEECTDFVLKNLDLPHTDEKNQATACALGTHFGFLPISMKSAVSIIAKQKERQKHEGTVSYGIQDLINDYERGKSSGLFPEMSLWNVSFEKILKDEKNGELAIKIICFMAYLSPNAIPRDFLRAFFQNTNERDHITDAFLLLTDYSLITFSGTDYYTIHRMIQEAAIQNLRLTPCPESNSSKSTIFADATFPNEIEVLTNLSKQLQLYLSTMKEPNFDVNSNCLYVTSYLSHDILSIPECRSLTASVAKIMEETCNFNKAVELYKKLQDSVDPVTDIDKKELIEIKDKFGGVLDYQEKYKEALTIFSEILVEKTKVFGMNHPSTLETQMNIINTMLELGSYIDAKKKFNEVEEGIKNIMDLEDPAALIAKYNFACLLYSYKKYDRALALFQNVIKEYEKSPEHDQQLSKLRTQSMIAEILSIQDKHEDTATLYRNIIANSNKITNKDTLTYRKNYAYAVYRCGSRKPEPELKPELEEALVVYEQVLKDEEQTLHPNESQFLGTSVTKHNIASVLTDLGRFDEAIEILMNLVEFKVSEYGSDHLLTLDTMHYLAVTLRKRGDYDESMEIYQLVLKGRQEKLDDPCHIDILRTKTNIGWAYFHKKEFKNADKIVRDILSTRDDPNVDGTPRFDYCEAEELQRNIWAKLPLKTRICRRIIPEFKSNGTVDQSAGGGIMLKEKSKKKLDELYGFTIRAVHILNEDENPDD